MDLNSPVTLPPKSTPTPRSKLNVWVPADMYVDLKVIAARRRTNVTTLVLALLRREVEANALLHSKPGGAAT
jgi:hypothetical protein